MLVESGGDNLTATFSYGLVDKQIFVVDVAGGDKVPRKGGPGVTRSDLLVINKTDLAPLVGADLEVMRTDAERLRGDLPTVLVVAARAARRRADRGVGHRAGPRPPAVRSPATGEDRTPVRTAVRATTRLTVDALGGRAARPVGARLAGGAAPDGRRGGCTSCTPRAARSAATSSALDVDVGAGAVLAVHSAGATLVQPGAGGRPERRRGGR